MMMSLASQAPLPWSSQAFSSSSVSVPSPGREMSLTDTIATLSVSE